MAYTVSPKIEIFCSFISSLAFKDAGPRMPTDDLVLTDSDMLIGKSLNLYNTSQNCLARIKVGGYCYIINESLSMAFKSIIIF